MLIRWLKGKISNQTEGEHKIQTDRNPQGVCVSCECCGREWTNQRRETHSVPLQRADGRRFGVRQFIGSLGIKMSVNVNLRSKYNLILE